MHAKKSLPTVLIVVFLVSSASVQAADEKPAVSFESLESFITAESFEVDFPAADSNYHSIAAASDGNIYFSMNTHNPDYAVRFYRFEPGSKNVTLLGKLDEVLNEDAAEYMPQGKIHTPLFEHKGKLWFATHTSFYDGGLPGIDAGDKETYPGGHFVSYDLKTGRFEDLAQVFANEGIITMVMDTVHEVLYGLTWPSGLLVSYDINTDDLRYWGAVQHRGEWGHHPQHWDRVCRTLAVDPDGFVYGSTMDGHIWKYDRSQSRRVATIDGLDLSRVPFTQSADATLKGDFQNNWRTIRWNPSTRSFWGVHFECTTLFEFVPSTNYIRALAELRPQAYQGLPRNPEVSQLGFEIGPGNTIFYLAHGPAVEMDGRPPVQSGLYLLTYDIDREEFTDHGTILTSDGNRRVFFSESLAIGPDDHIYTVAWVEVTDPKRIEALQAARQAGAPAETEKMVYEMQAVWLPKWKTFVK